MRCVFPLGVGFVIAVASGFEANAQGPWYVSGSVGGYFRDSDSEAATFIKNGSFATTEGTVKRSFDPGVIGDFALGYRIGPSFRVEAELGYAEYDGDHINPLASDPNFPNLDGRSFARTSGEHYSRAMGSLNGFYDFPTLAVRFTPYVGAGVGGSDNRKSAGTYTSANGVPFATADKSSPEALALLEGGVTIRLSDHWALVPAYRYTQFFRSNEDSAHVVRVSLRYGF